MAITRTGVVISTNPTFGDSDDRDFYINGGQLGINQVPVSGLTPDTVYYAKGYVQQDGTTVTDPSYTAFRTLVNPTPPTPTTDYLRATNTTDYPSGISLIKTGTQLTGGPYLDYSVDDGDNWTRQDLSTAGQYSIKVPANGSVIFKGTNSTFNQLDRYVRIYADIYFNISGDVNTIINETGGDITLPANAFFQLFEGNTCTFTGIKLPSTSIADSAYYNMFKSCTRLTAQPSMPARVSVGTYGCYGMFENCSGLASFTTKFSYVGSTGCMRMFYGCTSLASVPSDIIPGGNAPNKGYVGMFGGCTSLTHAPALPATVLNYNCYQQMFYGCTGLTTAPTLNATTLAKYCYYEMFYGCSGLTSAPALPATTLATYCYQGMFRGCTHITTAPTLNATTLKDYCYKEMFYGCSALNSVTFKGNNWGSVTDSLLNWLSGVSSTGDFYYTGTSSNIRHAGIVPTNWTIHT